MQIIRLDQIQNLLGDNPKDPFLLFALAKEYEKLGQFEQSIRQYNYLKEINPNYVGLYYNLGKSYECEDLNDEAKNTYHLGIQIAEKLNDLHSKKELEQALNNLLLT